MQKFEWCGRSPIEPFNPAGHRERSNRGVGLRRARPERGRSAHQECADSQPPPRRGLPARRVLSPRMRRSVGLRVKRRPDLCWKIRLKKSGIFKRKWSNFGGLVLFCIEADFCNQILVVIFSSFFSRSTGFTHLRIAPNSKYSQKSVKLFRIFVRISAKIISSRQISSNFTQISIIFSRDFEEHSRKCWEVLEFSDFMKNILRIVSEF